MSDEDAGQREAWTEKHLKISKLRIPFEPQHEILLPRHTQTVCNTGTDDPHTPGCRQLSLQQWNCILIQEGQLLCWNKRSIENFQLDDIDKYNVYVRVPVHNPQLLEHTYYRSGHNIHSKSAHCPRCCVYSMCGTFPLCPGNSISTKRNIPGPLSQLKKAIHATSNVTFPAKL